MLTSLQNPRVKLARQLQQRREIREREGLFVAEGVRLTDDFVQAGIQAAFAFVADAPNVQAWQQAHPGVECTVVNDAVMREVSVETTPPGVLVVFRQPEVKLDDVKRQAYPLILILDALRDPGNLGACLRVAAGADCRLVLLAPGCVDAYNPKVIRGGMGAHARLTIASLGWEEIGQVCAGHSIWSANAAGARRYDEVPWVEPNALIIGGEASGISSQARHISTGAVCIPLANQLESLNAAVACGVILFEAARQRQNYRNLAVNGSA
jgi:TrmH family RNA methyltransferase